MRQFHTHRILEDIGRGSELRKWCESRNIGMELISQDLAEAERGNLADFTRVLGRENRLFAIVTQDSEHIRLSIVSRRNVECFQRERLTLAKPSFTKPLAL